MWLERILRLFRLPAVVYGYVSLVLLAIMVHWLGADPDLFARVAVGRIVEATGGVARFDPFAFTPRHAQWIDHEWLSGVVFYQLSQWGGDRLLFGFKVLVMLATLALLLAAQWKYATRREAVFGWLLLTVVPCVYVWLSTIRSQVFTYLFLSVFLLAMVVHRRNRDWRLLAALPLCMLAWANLHGGFVVGLGLLGLFAASLLATAGPRPSLPALAALVGCMLATLINPYGIDYWRYILSAIRMDRPTITEWMPVEAVSILGVLIIVYGAIFVVGTWRGRRRPHPEVILMLAISLVFAFRSARLVAIFLMILAVYGTDAFAGVKDIVAEWLGERRYRALGRVLEVYLLALAPFLLAATIGFAARFGSFSLDTGFFPVGAVEWLRTQRDGGRLLVHFNYGSFALWRLYPHFLVSLDGRYEEVYPESTVTTVYRALDVTSPHHVRALSRIAPDFILLKTDARSFAQRERFREEWRLIYRDEEFALLERAAGGRPAPVTREPRPLWEPGF